MQSKGHSLEAGLTILDQSSAMFLNLPAMLGRRSRAQRICLFLLAWGWSGAIGAQSRDEPKLFEPGLISTGHEAAITFTRDGQTVYFARRVERKMPAHIYRSRLTNGVWQAPEQVHLGADSSFDVDPCISPDGKQLYFASTRPLDATDEGKPNMHIWVAEAVGQDWTNPRPVENVNSKSKEGTPTVARDGTLYFFSDRNAEPGKNSIYVATLKDGKYQSPVLLPPPVNSGASDTSPFISPDGRVLLFYSMRPGGKGNADLYVSHHRHGRWTDPQNLGSIVNSSEEEDNPVVSPEGRRFFFGRNGNIYSVSTSAIPVLKGSDFR
jgi:Tol biopolymer transport system component